MRCLNAALKDNASLLYPRDIYHLSVLTHKLVQSPYIRFNHDQFQLCLLMFSQTLSFCDLNTTINPIISTEDLKQFFEVFVVEWHYMNILKDKMYYLDYKSEVKFWEDFITENSFPKSTKWAEIVENFLTYRYKDYKIPHNA